MRVRRLYINLNQGVVSTGERTPRENLYDQLLMFNEWHKDVREKLVANPDIPTSDLIDIVLSSEVELRKTFALNDSNWVLLPRSLWEALLYDEDREVRLTALLNENTTFDMFREAVLFGNYPKRLKAELSSSLNALKSLEVFTTLWKSGGATDLIWNLNHYLYNKTTTRTALDQSLIDFVNDNILLEKFNSPKKCYAYAYEIATPENLDQLKTSTHSPLLNAIASNVNAWSSTHRYLLAQNSNSYTRGIIAETSTDNILLNEIYQATKGKATRKQLADNLNFILLS